MQVELGKLEDRLRELTDRRRPLAAQLNAALNRPADAPTPWPAELAPPPEPYEIEPLVAALRQRNPDLAALQRQLEQHRVATELARKDAWPDIMLKLDYIVTGQAQDASMPDSGKDPIIAGVSVNLPIWRDRYEASVRESIKRRLATASARADLENQLIAGLEMAVFDHADAARKVELYRDSLLPKARESLEASIIGYQNATVGFLDLLDAERVLLALELAKRRACTDAANAAATIHMLAGGDPANIALQSGSTEDAP
jgi:outer membrane protein TolC